MVGHSSREDHLADGIGVACLRRGRGGCLFFGLARHASARRVGVAIGALRDIFRCIRPSILVPGMLRALRTRREKTSQRAHARSLW